MLQVSDAFLSAINADVREMPYRVTLAGSTVLKQSQIPNMSLSESMSGGSGLALGTSNAAELHLTLRDPLIADYSGLLVEPESGIVLPDGSIEWVPLGKFWVTKSQTSNDYKTVKLSCIDGMYRLSGEYVSELTYPTSIQAVVRELIAKSGVDFVEPDSWPDVVVRVKPTGLSLRSAFGYVAGCCGKNARFNRYGQMEFVWYTDTGITIERDTQYMDGMARLNDKPLQVDFEVTGAVEKYNVHIVCGKHGSATASPGSSVLEGDEVMISVRPDSFYEMASITAHTAAGDSVPLKTAARGSGYTFIQPDSDVTVTVAFASEGLRELTVLSDGNGSIIHAPGTYDEGPDFFKEGDSVPIIVTPAPGFAVDSFTTVPAGIPLTYKGETDDGSPWYRMMMPDCDATVKVHFKDISTYRIDTMVDNIGFPTRAGYVIVENLTTPGYEYRAGDVIAVCFARCVGYAFDRYESNIAMTQIDNDDFQFVMPAHDVSITSYWKYSEDEDKEGTYSWLQKPVEPPTPKPYWAVFYKEDPNAPASQKFWLIWFDNWYTSSVDGGFQPFITFEGYYYCGSKNTGHGNHEWDDSIWSGNGASGSTLTWEARLDGVSYPYHVLSSWTSIKYCLIASNIPLLTADSLLFEKCENAIQEPQASYIQDGMDVREKGSLAYESCPDTYSTPAPAANWMLIHADSYLFMTSENEHKVKGRGTFVVFFDDINITNVGDALEGYTGGEDFFVASVTNGSYVGWHEMFNGAGTPEAIANGFLIGLRSPLVSTKGVYKSGSVGFNGILASSVDLYCGGEIFMYKNSCRVCDCEPAVRMFSRRSTTGYAKPVTLTYTNPMIYEKMVPAIQAAVQGMTYTPAKVKHRGNPAFQAGDIVTVPDGDGNYHTVLIMQQTLTFGGGMNSEITCPGQTAETANFTANGPITTQIKQEVNQSYSDLERMIAANNSAIFASIYEAFGTTSESMQRQLVNLNQTVIESGERITTIEESQKTLEENLSYAEQDIADTKERTDALEEAMDGVQADVDSLEARVSAMEGGSGGGTGGGDTGSYVLPQATDAVLGGIKAKAREATDTQEVRVDPETGFLYTAPGGGGGGEDYTLPQATAEALGGVKAVAKTTEETPVAVDASGQLFVPENSNGNRDLLAQYGSLPYDYTANTINAMTRIPWVAETDCLTAVKEYKMFQITILSSTFGDGFTSHVFGNPAYGEGNPFFDSWSFYFMLKPGVYIQVIGCISGGGYTFAVTPLDANGTITTISGVGGIGVYGIK